MKKFIEDGEVVAVINYDYKRQGIDYFYENKNYWYVASSGKTVTQDNEEGLSYNEALKQAFDSGSVKSVPVVKSIEFLQTEYARRSLCVSSYFLREITKAINELETFTITYENYISE